MTEAFVGVVVLYVGLDFALSMMTRRCLLPGLKCSACRGGK